MTPDALHTLAAICSLLEKVGTWPIGTVLLVVFIGPWVFALVISRAEERRVEAMKAMYENNVKLVESYQELAQGMNDVITLNTAKWSKSIDMMDRNQFCPSNRTKKQVMEDIG